MNITIDLVFVAQSITVLVLGLGVRGIFQLSATIHKLNGRVSKLETWSIDHEKYSATVHDDIKANIRDIISNG
jgi:hypothetical protein